MLHFCLNMLYRCNKLLLEKCKTLIFSAIYFLDKLTAFYHY